MKKLEPIYYHTPDVYSMEGFTPHIIDREYLQELGVKVIPDDDTIEGLIRGSQSFIKRLETKTVIPVPYAVEEEISLDSQLEIHNYTDRCPTLTYEVSPVKGCMVGCLYCLVTDGVHEQQLVTYTNYDKLLTRLMETHKDDEHYYYFSAKTEALQEATLQTGIAHNILRTFIAHFEKYPDSKARLFIASKAGIKHLLIEHEGESIIDLFTKLKGKMQFNTSLSIMPTELRTILEPYAAPTEDRMAAVRLCQERGVLSNSALVQPIFPSFLTPERLKDFFTMLNENNIVNYKPEFLTVCMENLAWIGQILGSIDRDLERGLYEFYLAPENQDHRKQRGRTAPNRSWSLSCIKDIMRAADEFNISTSICYWVRHELNISEELIPIVNKNGFQCLGYQRRLFESSACG